MNRASSLYRARKPANVTPGCDVVARSTPAYGLGRFWKPGISYRNRPRCPLGGKVITADSPLSVPSKPLRVRVTVAGESDEFARATAGTVARASGKVPDISAYILNSFDAVTPSTVTVSSGFSAKPRTAYARGANEPEVGTTSTCPPTISTGALWLASE